MPASIRQKPGRKSSIATHPGREAIEAACAAGVHLRTIASRFGVGLMAVHRYWNALPAEYRSALAAAVVDMDDARWREVTAGLAAIARRHPTARADIDALAQRLSATMPCLAAGGSARAA